MRDMITPEERLNLYKTGKDQVIWFILMFFMILGMIVLFTC